MDPEDPSSAFTQDDDSPWFDKNVDVGQSTSSLTESTDHDELSGEFNPDLTQSDEHSELTNDDELLTEKIPQDHDVLSQEELHSGDNEVPSLPDNIESQTDSKTESEEMQIERELLEDDLSLEDKKDDITKELTDMFFQTEDKSEFAPNITEESKLVDEKEKIKENENEGDTSDDVLKNELKNILDEEKLLTPELDSKTMDVVQELQEHIKLADQKEKSKDFVESKDMQSDLDKICSVTKESVSDLLKSEDKVDKELENESMPTKMVVNTIDETELSKEPMMVEFAHDDESRAVAIKLKTDDELEDEEPKPEGEVIKPGDAETIVMETDEGEKLVFDAEVIATENNPAVMNVEGGAEFLEAVTGNIDLLEPGEEEEEEEEEVPVARKKNEQPKCFVASCKSGKVGSRTVFRFFKPPVSAYFFKKWQTILTQSGDPMTPDSTVCELHFKAGHIYKKSIDENGTVIWGLREGALPSVYNVALPKTLFKTVNIPKGTKNETVHSPAVSKNISLLNTKGTSNVKTYPKPKSFQKPIRPAMKHMDMNDPTFILHNRDLIRHAQDEILSLDVLVCGDCRTVFHFMEDFSDHKNGACNGTSNFKANPAEPKAQVWAFLLWKSAQAKVLTDIESPWKLYQRWCKMDDNVRDSWITAGRVLMDTTNLAHSKIVESLKPGKVGRPPIVHEEENSEDEDEESQNTNIIKRKISKEPESDTFEDESEESRVDDGGVDAAEDIQQEEEPMDFDSDEDRMKTKKRKQSAQKSLPEDVEIKEEVMSEDEEDVKGDSDSKETENVKGRLRTRHSQPSPVSKSKPSKQAKPAGNLEDSQDEEEFVVEKIVSRRYNSKKRHFEYLLKWEGYPSEQNTWEPAENMATCQHLLKAFEANLVKQQQAKQAGVKTPVQPKKKNEIATPGTSGLTSQGRPDRRSKQKALDQVKVWCGSMKPTDDEYNKYGSGLKRKIDSDSDFDDDEIVPVKKVKTDDVKRYVKTGQRVGRPPLESKPKPALNGFKKESNLAAALGLESDSENDSERPNVPSPTPEKNTPVVRKMSSLSVQNQQVLVANAKGVVKVDPSQVPNLTSGVYIMSNTSGIIKVDNMSSKNALSSLQKQGIIPKKASPVSTTSPPPLVMVGSNENSTPKSGILKRPPVPILPKTTGTPTRPLGLLKPLRPGISPRPLGSLKPGITPSPRLPGIPSGLSTKIQSAVRPKGTIPSLSSSIRPKPLSPQKQPVVSPTTTQKPSTPLQKTTLLQKPTLQKPVVLQKPQLLPKASPVQKTALKPIESILGGGLAAQQQKLLLAKKKAALADSEDGIKSSLTPNRRLYQHPLVFKNRGRGLGRGFAPRGRGSYASRGSSLGALLKVDQNKEMPIKESKLVDNDSMIMEFREDSESESDDGGLSDHFPDPDEPIEPDSPPRPLSLCPLTGKVLLKAEGERTPEPTPPPSPKPPTPPPPPVVQKIEVVDEPQPASILPDEGDGEEEETGVVKGMMCKVEMSPGGTTGTLLETGYVTPSNVTEGTVTIKRPAQSHAVLRGPQLSVLSGANANTSLGTITVPARKIFQDESGTITADDDVVTITGEDGLVYQVSNADVSGNTILMASGEDGQQQCVYVTAEPGEGGGDESTILTLDTAYADAVAQLGTEQFYIKEDEGGELVTLEGEEGSIVGTDDQGGQVVAQLVEAGEPAPGGGPRRVVLLLPDGNLMMTEVDEEQYAALDLDK